jgi:hypothetical protein
MRNAIAIVLFIGAAMPLGAIAQVAPAIAESERIMEYSCHEDNRAMANILSAARSDERAGRASNAPTAAEGER